MKSWLQSNSSSSPDSASPESLSADHYYRLGVAAREQKNDEDAFRLFARANSLIPRFEPARDALKAMAAESFAGMAADLEPTDKIYRLARVIEMDPFHKEARELQKLLLDARKGGPDLTKMCFIFYDGDRAQRIHDEAYRRALEFVTIGGVVGDVFEFGVLGGWSSRIFAEIMRDIFNLNNLYLYDSFEGLPEYDSSVDRESYEIGGRNIWSDKMKFPADFLKQFGQEHYWHIRDRLSEVIRADRIIVKKGFYSETLKEKINGKAAIVHLDCDLYQSTIEVFQGLYVSGALQDGTVLLFDDWNCNRASPNYGQRRALREFLASQRKYSATPWFTYGYNGAAYILHDNEA